MWWWFPGHSCWGPWHERRVSVTLWLRQTTVNENISLPSAKLLISFMIDPKEKLEDETIDPIQRMFWSHFVCIGVDVSCMNVSVYLKVMSVSLTRLSICPRRCRSFLYSLTRHHHSPVDCPSDKMVFSPPLNYNACHKPKKYNLITTLVPLSVFDFLIPISQHKYCSSAFVLSLGSVYTQANSPELLNLRANLFPVPLLSAYKTFPASIRLPWIQMYFSL